MNDPRDLNHDGQVDRADADVAKAGALAFLRKPVTMPIGALLTVLILAFCAGAWAF